MGRRGCIVSSRKSQTGGDSKMWVSASMARSISATKAASNAIGRSARRISFVTAASSGPPARSRMAQNAGTHERRGTAMTAMTMTIEPVSAFSSLDVLVAMDEGLFRAEGLDLRMASRESRDIRSTTEGTLSSPVTNQGGLQKRGEATMFQG